MRVRVPKLVSVCRVVMIVWLRLMRWRTIRVTFRRRITVVGVWKKLRGLVIRLIILLKLQLTVCRY